MKKYACLILFLFLSFASLAQLPSYTVSADDSTIQGYYFLRLAKNPAILDGRGNVVYYFTSMPGDAVNGYFGLLPGGKMTFGGTNNYMITDSAFNIIDSVACKNIPNDPHELLMLPNGHFLLLGADTVRMDVSKYCFFRGQCGSKNAIVRWAVIQEQDAKKNVVWEWHARDHFTVEDADTFYLDSPVNLDVNHANSLDVDKDGNILMSSRNMNEITKINRKTGKIIWRMGGNHNQFKFVNCSVPFYAQHDARRIANPPKDGSRFNRDGHITVFDNGENKISHSVRGLEFEVDEKNKTTTLVWSFGLDSAYSGGWGNVQRLAHSNTLVCFGKIGDNKPCFVVVDSSGDKLFQLDGNTSYRVLYYPSLPWQVHRPQITCFDSINDTHYLDAGAGYSSYRWNTGDTTRIIPVPVSRDYYVFVPYGKNGFVSSEKIKITDIRNPCATLPERSTLKPDDRKKKK